MKRKSLQFFTSAILLVVVGFLSCKDSYVEKRTYTAYVPKYMTYDDLRSPVKLKAASEVVEMGKIYIKDQYLFVNEKYKGVHVFDNSNPASPVNLSFIDIPGNVDIAIKGTYLFADSYVDLVVINIRNIENPVEVARIENIFPYTIPEIREYIYPISGIDQEKGVITGWEVKEITENVESGDLNRYYYFDKTTNVFTESGGNLTGGTSQTVGIGGSLARFIIYGDYFYGLNQFDMQVVDITLPYAPVVGNKLQMQRTVETVFIDSTHLFIGTQTGMMIYSLNQPSAPSFITTYEHIQSCDPVVVQDNLAYVTLRAGNICGNFQSALEVIDLHVISSPQLIRNYPMTEPYGLGIDNKKLFVCDGPAGLKVYDASDPIRIDEHLITTFTDVIATDVIPFNNILILLAADGIYQYDYSDLNNMQLLSKINIGG
jgi:hypothetical protein